MIGSGRAVLLIRKLNIQKTSLLTTVYEKLGRGLRGREGELREEEQIFPLSFLFLFFVDKQFSSFMTKKKKTKKTRGEKEEGATTAQK